MSGAQDNSDVIVRPAIKSDMVEVASMIQELAEFEKMPNGPSLTAKDLIRDAFEVNPPLFRCKVAEKLHLTSSDDVSSEQILGYAIYFNTYSTWEGKSLMLEDLYVRASQRRKGIGAKLFEAVAQEATTSGCSRVDFHVLRWNPASDFYERRGAVNLTDTDSWAYYRLSGEALKQVALYSAHKLD